MNAPPAIATVMGVVLTVLTTSPSPGQNLEALCRQFSGHDQDGDGSPELAALECFDPESSGASEGRVLVLVESRLLAPLSGAPDVAPAIQRLVADLRAEGHRTDAVRIALGPGHGHQDGEFILALREFLRSVHATSPLAGVLLVGHFPDAFVVRTCNWRRKGSITLRRKKPDEVRYESVPFLRRVPEDVAHRADIVLADLDGRWEDVYVRDRARLESVVAVYPKGIPPHGGPCTDLERGGVTFEDFFHVVDGKLEVYQRPGAEDGEGWGLQLFDEAGNHECGPPDAGRPNPLARPDINISRIDARGVAWNPRQDILGVDGKGLLDEAGRPRRVGFSSSRDIPHWRDGLWEPDPVLERRLLLDFLDRNHAYRTGEAKTSWRPASLACDLPSGYGEMARGAADWEDADPSALDIHGRPTLEDVVAWLSRPALFRTLRAHSDPWGSVFKRSNTKHLDAALSGPALSWSPSGDALVPSLRAACAGGKLDWFLLRSLWEANVISPEPAFYVHTGCHGISPPSAKHKPFSHPAYGARQGGESLLFFGRGLALVGRAKVFYDEPREFAVTLAHGHTFGAAWARYFEVESGASSWSRVGGDIGRKRAYFWSLLGDWTLTLAMGAPRDGR